MDFAPRTTQVSSTLADDRVFAQRARQLLERRVELRALAPDTPLVVAVAVEHEEAAKALVDPCSPLMLVLLSRDCAQGGPVVLVRVQNEGDTSRFAQLTYFAAGACRPAPTGPVARVAGVTITAEEAQPYVDEWLAEQRKRGAVPEAMNIAAERAGVVAKLIERAIFASATSSPAPLPEARTRDELDQSIRRLRDQLGAVASPTDAELRTYYGAHLESFTVQRSARAAMIVLPSEDEARAVRVLVDAAGADFAAIAKQRSRSPTAVRGGDLGVVAQGRMKAAWENVVFAARAGDVVGPFELDGQWYIVRVHEQMAATTKSYDVVVDDVRARWMAERRTAAVKEARARAHVEILQTDFSAHRLSEMSPW
jgi:hypothetical protein